jgi:predicted PolB exonuclease-like 3'-5' exonuclease
VSIGNTDMVVDIETVPNMKMAKRNPRTFTAPKNYKDEEKIRGYIEQRHDEWMEQLPLDLDYARISCIGISVGDKPAQAFVDGQPKSKGDGIITESGLLQWFWAEAKKASTILGYNIQGFDLPIIQRRSWKLGVEPTVALYALKPWDDKVIDLMRRFYHNGYGPGVKYRGLKQVCAMFGIGNRMPEVDGSMVGEMDAETLAAYCASDVEMTRELAIRTRGHYWG